MSLRLRLVVGLVALMSIGLVVYGFATYAFYSRAQYRQLDTDLRASVPLVGSELARAAGVQLDQGPQPAVLPVGGDSGGAPGGAAAGGPPHDDGRDDQAPLLVAPGTYGELIDSSGTVLAHVQEVASSAQPRLTAAQLHDTGQPQLVTVGSATGDDGWRAYIGTPSSAGYRVVVAVPTSRVTSSLHRLLLFEAAGGAGLLVLLSVGAGLVLRRGLSPIERMADTARAIARGDLGRRAEAASPASEVGQLGLAFNTMLDEIQAAFAARDATEQRLRQFLADASHELRTPLTSIRGFAELFRLGAGESPVDHETIMRRIEEESDRMKDLVEDLLLLARLDQVKAVEKAPVDLSVLAADACSDALASAPGRPITLDAPDPLVVLGVEPHLRQALANLLSNALRHTPDGTSIEVTTRAVPGRAEVTVRDHGPGLDSEALEHVFDRFWQKDPSRSGTGAGLGLAIVAAVAAEHGGSAGAANAPGGGAEFVLTVPLGGGGLGAISQA